MSQPAQKTDVPSIIGTDFLSEARRQLSDCSGTIRHCLAQMDDNQVWWRRQAYMNSVGNLVLHLTGNLRQRFLSDIGGEPASRDRFSEFTERRAIPRDELLRQFEDVIGQIDAVLARMPVKFLGHYRQYAVSEGTIDCSVQALIIRTLMHLAGHTQEIVFITRSQLAEGYLFKNPAGVPPSMRTGSG